MECFFDPREIDREPTVEVLHDGTYAVQIEKVYKKLDNFGLKVRVFYKTLDKNQYVMEHFNVEHGNEKAQEIGRQNFAKLLDSIGMGDAPLNNEQELCGKRLKIELSVEPHYKDPSSSQNKVKRHLPLNALDVNNLNKKGTGEVDIPF